jgi:hypothetical protein
MGCCIGLLIGLLVPRVALIIYWIFTPHLGRAFTHWVWPLLGFLFMPYTTLFYLWGMIFGGGIEGFWLVLVILGVVLDLSSYGSGGRARGFLRSRS